jgi:hypothetical protein
MKAISLWQPWASLMAEGLKTIETRSWATGYRGSLAIHAAKRSLTVEERMLIQDWRNARLLGWEWAGTSLPFGAILAVVDLVDCVPAGNIVPNELNAAFGNFAPGRWAWITRNCHRLPIPFPCRGAQGLFDVLMDITELPQAEPQELGLDEPEGRRKR